MTYGELFAGIGGLSLGLERAGMECRFQVEIDLWCRKVLDKHWPGVPKYGDVTQVTGAELGYVDVLAGGFPCQDVSQAGKRAGMFDGDGRTTRTGLWVEFARLIGELRPRYVVAENVPGLLTSRGAMGRVIGDLAALGYLGFYVPVRASDFGASHIRKRVFIVGIRRDVVGYTTDDNGRRGIGGTQAGVGTNGIGRRGSAEPDAIVGDSASARSGSGEPGAGGEIRDRARRPESGGRCDAVANPSDGLVSLTGRRPERRDGAGPAGEILANAERAERWENIEHDAIPGGRQQATSGPSRDGAVMDDAKRAGLEVRDGFGKQQVRQVPEPFAASLPTFAPGPADPRWPDILRTRPDLAPAIDLEEWEASAQSGFCGLADELSAGLVRSAMKDRTKKLKGFGNAVVPACAEYIGRLIMQHARR